MARKPADNTPSVSSRGSKGAAAARIARLEHTRESVLQPQRRCSSFLYRPRTSAWLRWFPRAAVDGARVGLERRAQLSLLPWVLSMPFRLLQPIDDEERLPGRLFAWGSVVVTEAFELRAIPGRRRSMEERGARSPQPAGFQAPMSELSTGRAAAVSRGKPA